MRGQACRQREEPHFSLVPKTLPKPTSRFSSLHPSLTCWPSFGDRGPEGGRSIVGGQGLPKPAGVTVGGRQSPISHIWAGHGGSHRLWAESTVEHRELGDGVESFEGSTLLPASVDCPDPVCDSVSLSPLPRCLARRHSKKTTGLPQSPSHSAHSSSKPRDTLPPQLSLSDLAAQSWGLGCEGDSGDTYVEPGSGQGRVTPIPCQPSKLLTGAFRPLFRLQLGPIEAHTPPLQGLPVRQTG